MLFCVHVLFSCSLWETYVILNTVCEKRIALSEIQFSQRDDSIHTCFLKFLSTGFEVLTVVKIHNVVWFRTLYSLVHGYACFGRVFCCPSPQAV